MQPTPHPNPAARGHGPAAALIACSKIYGSFAALRNLSVTFPLGSITMLLGENGAGKSTLLRVIAGLINPTRGKVEVYGAPPQSERRRMAYMSHAPMLYDELSAIENLQYFSGLHREPGGCACVGNPEMALRAVGLDPFLKRPVGQYSQGMRQRTSLARVLQTGPPAPSARRALLQPRRSQRPPDGRAPCRLPHLAP